MKLTSSKAGTRNQGWALLVVLSLAATSLVVLASVMSWANENSTVVARNNEYFLSTYAAEAATEKVLAAMVQDDQNYGEGLVFSRTATYSAMLPGVNDSVPAGYWTNFQFSGGTTNNMVIVQKVANTVTNVMGPPYSGLQLVNIGTYEIIANAQNTNSQYGVVSTVGQQIVFAQIPVFQFAIFYNDAMEVDPASAMTVTGLVHGNTNIYADPSANLTFQSDVTASANIYLSKDPLDPSSRAAQSTTVTFDGQKTTGMNPLILPVGTNIAGNSNNSTNVYAILQFPPAGEGPNTPAGTNILYNKVDMIITISNGNVITVTSGAFNNEATIISNNQWSYFINTNNDFYDLRQSHLATTPVAPVNVDVGNLRRWSATNNSLRTALAAAPSRGSSLADVQSIWVGDFRDLTNAIITAAYTTNHGVVTTNYSTNNAMPGIVLTNGSSLPSNGLSVVTPDPLYIEGNWNTTSNGTASTAGTATVAGTLPSAIYADAITILSPNWNPNNSTQTLASNKRAATTDTVNAAFMMGIVPSDGTNFSGGVENFPRFLEDWTSATFWYNGSMVEMFPSQIATAPWLANGDTEDVYIQPTRNWAFDTNFNNPANLPPLTPNVMYLNRAKWTSLPPRTTQF